MKTSAFRRVFARNASTLLGWCVLAFSGIVAWLTSRFEPLGEAIRSLPPDFFPFLIAGALALLGAVLLLEGYRKQEARVFGLSYESGDYFRAVGLLAVLIAFAFAEAFAGFLLGAALFMAVAQLVLGERRVVPLLISSVSVSAMLYLVFYVALKVPLPRGLW